MDPCPARCGSVYRWLRRWRRQRFERIDCHNHSSARGHEQGRADRTGRRDLRRGKCRGRLGRLQQHRKQQPRLPGRRSLQRHGRQPQQPRHSAGNRRLPGIFERRRRTRQSRGRSQTRLRAGGNGRSRNRRIECLRSADLVPERGQRIRLHRLQRRPERTRDVRPERPNRPKPKPAAKKPKRSNPKPSNRK